MADDWKRDGWGCQDPGDDWREMVDHFRREFMDVLAHMDEISQNHERHQRQETPHHDPGE